MKKHRLICCLIFILAILFFALPADDSYAAKDVVKSIRVVMDDNYPPYSFRDSNENFQGITIEQ